MAEVPVLRCKDCQKPTRSHVVGYREVFLPIRQERGFSIPGMVSLPIVQCHVCWTKDQEKAMLT